MTKTELGATLGTTGPKWDARQLATMAIMLAIGIILSFVEFPILPGVEFLKYDASFVPSVFVGLLYGGGPGCVVGILIALVHALFSGNIIGAIMNAAIVVVFVLPPSLIYRKSKSIIAIIIGLLVGAIAATFVAIVMNLLTTPIYLGMPVDTLFNSLFAGSSFILFGQEITAASYILVFVLPFNLVKSVINILLIFVLQRSLKSFLEK
ncbi:MAG: ECF transporter S component [Coriobacteriales bacterium]|nr:ECF transporter S component [Coriobacteriales bacterium]